MAQKSLRAVGIRCWSALERSRDGVREGPGEKRRSDDAPARGVGAPGATPYRGKPLGGTGSALDHGGVAGFKGCRRCRRPRKGAAAAQGQIEGSSREYCNTLDFCQVGSKARVFLLFLTRTKRRKMAFLEGCPVGWGGSWPGGRGRPRGLIPGEGVREGLAWWGKGSGGVQGLRFREGRW